jgi:hypothetical protein
MVANCEQFANDATTLLASDVSTLDLVIPIVSTVTFPSMTPFRIMIDNEIMMVTGVLGNTFSVTRGLEETVIESHSVGSLVSGVLTNSSFFGFSECRFATGPRASLPMPELDGRLFLTQSPGWYLFRENGVAWRSWGPIFELHEGIDFESENWNWINVNDGVNPPAALTDLFGDLTFFTPASAGAGENIRLFTQPISAEAPFTPPYSVVAGFSPLLSPVNQTCCGIVFRESSTDKFIIFRIMYDDTSVTKRDLVMSLDKYDDPNTFNSNYKTLSAGTLISPLIFFKMEDDGINLNWYFSNDGFNFALFDSQLRTDFLAGGGPDETGVAFGTNNTTGTAGMNLHSWLRA